MKQYFRKSELRKNGLLPKGGIARFYGVAELYKEGQVREEVYERMPEAEKERDPQKLGSAVLVKIERAEDLSGEPLNIE